MTLPDPFVHFDAAYVFDALDDADRAAFEAHLPTCAACRARVDEATSTVRLLAPARHVSGYLDDEVPPDTLLPGLLARARRERRHRRLVTGAVAALAAACLVTLAVVAWPRQHTGPHPQALHAVRATPVSATAVLEARSWGTQIDVHCKYAHDLDTDDAPPYGLRVIDKSGAPHDAGTWRLADDGSVNFTGGTEVRRERIAKIQVTLPDGTPILELSL